MKPLRTIFLSSDVVGGGAGWSFYYLLKHLDRTKFEPLVVVPEGGIFTTRFAALGLRVRVARRLHDRTIQARFRWKNPLTTAASYLLNLIDSALVAFELAALARRERIELIYCNNMMVKFIGVIAGTLAGVPCVLHVRNLHDHPVKAWIFGHLARRRVVKRVIANSAASAEPYRRYVPDKVTVVHNGIDLAEYSGAAVPRGRFRGDQRIPADAVVVGRTGWLIPRKGIEPLIRAAALVLPSRPRLQFVSVGRVPLGMPKNYLAEYEGLVRELGIADRFRFAGYQEDVRTAVVDFDLLVMPSINEPFGRSIIEAMALGTPVIASRVGGIPEILTDQQDGVLVPPDDVPALASAIGALVDDPARREALAGAALDRVRQRFDVAVLSREVEALLLDAARAP